MISYPLDRSSTSNTRRQGKMELRSCFETVAFIQVRNNKEQRQCNNNDQNIIYLKVVSVPDLTELQTTCICFQVWFSFVRRELSSYSCTPLIANGPQTYSIAIIQLIMKELPMYYSLQVSKFLLENFSLFYIDILEIRFPLPLFKAISQSCSDEIRIKYVAHKR